MSDPGASGEPPGNVSALIDALDERARQAGSEGATTVLRGIMGSVAEVLNGIEARLAQIEDRMREADAEPPGAALAEQVQQALFAFNNRLGRLEEAFVRAVEDSGSGTETVIDQVRAVVESVIRDHQPTTPTEVTEGLAEVRDQLTGLAAGVRPLADLAEVREQLAALTTQVGQVAEVRDQVASLSTQVGEVAEVRDHLATLTTQVGQVAEVRDQVAELSTRVGQVAEVRDQAAELSTRVDQVAEVRDRLAALTTQVGQVAEVRDQVAALSTQVGPVAELRDQLSALSDQVGQLSEVGGRLDELGADVAQLVERTQVDTSPAVTLDPAQVADVAEVRGQVDQLATELTARLADVRDGVAEVAGTVADLSESLAAAATPAASADLLSPPDGANVVDAVRELVAEVQDLTAAVDDLREEYDRQRDSDRRVGALAGDGDGEASTSTREATAMLTSQVADLSAAIRAQNEAVAELRSLAGSLRTAAAATTARPVEDTAGLRASIEALRTDLTSALNRTEAVVVDSIAAPRPRRRLLPLLALIVALASIGFTLLPFTGTAGIRCDPPLLVANPDIRETARYRAPDPACEPIGNTRLIGSAAVAFLAVVIGTYAVVVPPRRRTAPPQVGRG